MITRNETKGKRPTTELPASLHTELKVEATRSGLTLAEATEKAVTAWLKTRRRSRRNELQSV